MARYTGTCSDARGRETIAVDNDGRDLRVDSRRVLAPAIVADACCAPIQRPLS